MITECIEPECFELTENASCLCDNHAQQCQDKINRIDSFLKQIKDLGQRATHREMKT